MFNMTNENSKKRDLLAQVFADASDPRIEFFCKKLTLDQLNALVSLRNMVFEKGEIERYSLSTYNIILWKEYYCEDCRKYLPGKEVNSFDAIFNLIVNSKHTLAGRELWQYGPLQRQRVSRLEGSKLPLMILLATLAIYLLLVNLAREADIQSESNIQNGLCILETASCQIEGFDFPDCFGVLKLTQKGIQEGISCNQGRSFFLLNFISLIILGAMANIYYHQQGNKLFQSMQNECDDAKYDELLNNILLKDDFTIDWSEKIKVKDATCTLRKLAISLLLCFDDRIYSELLPNFIKQLNTGTREISLEAQDMAIKIERINLVLATHTTPTVSHQLRI